MLVGLNSLNITIKVRVYKCTTTHRASVLVSHLNKKVNETICIYTVNVPLLHAQSNSKGGKNNIKYLYKIYVCYVGLYNRHSLYQWTSSCVNGHDTLRRKK